MLEECVKEFSVSVNVGRAKLYAVTVSSGQIRNSTVKFETTLLWRRILIVNLNFNCF